VTHIVTLFFHFIGVGILSTTLVAGYILHRQYLRAADLKTKAIILRSVKPIGLLSPLGSLIMLVSGIGNMHALGYTILGLPGWLAYKIIFYVLTVISGVLFGITSGKRGKLLQLMIAGTAPDNAEATLRSYERQIGLFYPVLTLIFVIILLLSISGHPGIQ
jgi:uncharacterized membrane protein